MPVPGTAGSFVKAVMPGMNPLGSVGVQVLPPSNVAFTAQPSLWFQSLAPVIMFSGLAGLTAMGVSFWAVVSRLTLTTVAEPAPRALKLGVPSVVMGASRHAASSRPAPRAVQRADRMESLRARRYTLRGDGC